MRRPIRVFDKAMTQRRCRSKAGAKRIEAESPPPYWRPRVRGECVNAARPCPYVACKYHLFLEARDGGSIKFLFGTDDVEVLERMPDTCALDVADRGAQHFQALADILNVTDARVQWEAVRAMGRASGVGDLERFTR